MRKLLVAVMLQSIAVTSIGPDGRHPASARDDLRRIRALVGQICARFD